MPAERVEMWDDIQSQARLKQLGARYNREKSKPGKQVYWAPAYQVWVIVTRSSGRDLRFEYWRNCPC